MTKTIDQLYTDNPVSPVSGTTRFEVSQAGVSGAADFAATLAYFQTNLAYTPSGGIAATTMVGAIAELDTEKVSKAGDTITANLTLMGDGVPANLGQQRFSNDAISSTNSFLKGRGSQTTPATVQMNDTVGQFDFYMHDGVGARLVGRMSTQAVAITPSPTNAEARITFLLGQAGLGSTGEIARLQHATGLSMYGANTVIGPDRLLNVRTYTVATLPSASIVGRVAYATNCRMFNGAGVRETGGNGTGGIVVSDGTIWKVTGTNVQALA